ncbi:MAG: dual specificity protein phosphatase family protein [Planctomycetales bacterium]
MPTAAAFVKSSSPAERAASAALSRRRWMLVLAFFLAGLAGTLLWSEVLKYRFIVKRWGVVEPGLIYRSGQISKWLIEDTLERHDIAVVIDLNGIEAGDVHQPVEIETVARLGLEHHRFPLAGNGTGDVRMYAEAIRVIHESSRAGRPVLVHCSAGTQRTGGVIACYRMLVQKQPPGEAYAELRRYEWDPQRDRTLLEYVNAHMEELARLLVANGVLAEAPDPLPLLQP